MATPDSKPTPKNRGNRRTGRARGYNGQKGGAHSLAWHEDPVLLGRLNHERILIARGHTSDQIVPLVNAWLATQGEPPITLDTVRTDRGRLRELDAAETQVSRDTAAALRAEHRDALIEVQREAWAAFHDASTASLNKSAYLGVIRGVRELLAKLDGSFAPAKVEVTNVAQQEELARFRTAIEAELPDPEARKRLALRVLRPDEQTA